MLELLFEVLAHTGRREVRLRDVPRVLELLFEVLAHTVPAATGRALVYVVTFRQVWCEDGLAEVIGILFWLLVLVAVVVLLRNDCREGGGAVRRLEIMDAADRVSGSGGPARRRVRRVSRGRRLVQDVGPRVVELFGVGAITVGFGLYALLGSDLGERLLFGAFGGSVPAGKGRTPTEEPEGPASGADQESR